MLPDDSEELRRTLTDAIDDKVDVIFTCGSTGVGPRDIAPETVEDVCRRIHRRFKDEFRYANVTGPSAKFPGQKVGLSHVLEDSDTPIC